MLTSGLSATVTTSDAPVTLLANARSDALRNLVIVNEGAVAGFFSIDGGATWFRLSPTAAGTSPVPLILSNINTVSDIMVKRIAAGGDLAGVYGYAW